jgi:c-di-GMP-binding flagellar brake protein YcgR
MAESEKIDGNGVTRIFEELLQRKTHLELNLQGTDYQQLTIVTALRTQKSDPSFYIDTPEGFREATADIDPWHIRFEFTGKDNIKYIFHTVGGRISDHRIKIKLPEFVERRQRRRLFRINAPAGTLLCFAIGATRYEFEVIDMSLGGSLAVMVQTDSYASPEPPLPGIGELKDVELVFPKEIYHQAIRIETAQIKRTKKNTEVPSYEMALEFAEMSNRHENLLTDLIYRLQRRYLRKRLPLDI